MDDSLPTPSLPSPNGQERRRSARMPVEMWVEEMAPGGVVHRRAGNLSRGGMYLDQAIPLPIGTVVRLRFTLPEDKSPVEVDASIVFCEAQPSPGMGLKFVRPPEEIVRRIERFIERASTPPMGVTTV